MSKGFKHNLHTFTGAPVKNLQIPLTIPGTAGDLECSDPCVIGPVKLDVLAGDIQGVAIPH